MALSVEVEISGAEDMAEFHKHGWSDAVKLCDVRPAPLCKVIGPENIVADQGALGRFREAREGCAQPGIVDPGILLFVGGSHTHLAFLNAGRPAMSFPS